jgi:DNA-binding LytR/AlgR family response regulator
MKIVTAILVNGCEPLLRNINDVIEINNVQIKILTTIFPSSSHDLGDIARYSPDLILYHLNSDEYSFSLLSKILALQYGVAVIAKDFKVFEPIYNSLGILGFILENNLEEDISNIIHKNFLTQRKLEVFKQLQAPNIAEEANYLFIPQVSGYDCIEFNNIIYATIKKDIISLHLKNNDLKKYKGKMKDLEKILLKYSFFLINRQDIINIKEIRQLSLDDIVTLSNGDSLQISRDKIKEFKKMFFFL